MNSFLSKIKEYPFVFSLFFSLFTGVIAKVCFGFFYEEYQSLFTAALSGVLTPGMVYDNMYYMAYVGGLSVLYAHLSAWFPNIPVINIADYLIIISALTVFYYVYIKTIKKISLLEIAFIAVLSMEYFVLYNCTRVSIIACLASGVLFFYSLKNQKLFFSKTTFLFLIFWAIGLLTRIESALFTLCLTILMFFLLMISVYRWKVAGRYIFLLLFCIGTILSMLVYVNAQLRSSNEFYLQIEPECEVEIMFKQNMIPVSMMKNQVDSIRYEAVKSGVWGDARTNDVRFLKSLIDEQKSGNLVYWKGFSGYSKSIQLFFDSFRLYLLSGFFFFIYLLMGRARLERKMKISLTAFLLLAFIFVLFIAVQVKLTHQVTIPLITGVLIFMLIISNLYGIPVRQSFISRSLLVGLSIFLVWMHCHNISDEYQNRIERNQHTINSTKGLENAQTLVLGKKYFDMLFSIYHPFEKFEIFQKKKVLIVNNLAFNTIQPYKTYLGNTLDCNPEDYASMLPAIRKYDPDALYLFTPEEYAFFKKYMRMVHNIDVGYWEAQQKKL